MILTDVVSYCRQLIEERARTRDKVHALDSQVDELIRGMTPAQLAEMEIQERRDFLAGPEDPTVMERIE